MSEVTRNTAFLLIFCLCGLFSDLLAQTVGKTTIRPADAHAEVKGMTISCPGSGRSWGSDAMVDRMESLSQQGVNWITIHPYGSIRNNGAIKSSYASRAEAPQWIQRPIKEAHRLGLKIMVKPHIAYWGSGFSWRGAIEFSDQAERARFWTDYRRWIVGTAKLSRGADAFVVGTELDRFLTDEKEWRATIKAIRKVFKGPLTYAANWTDYQRVPFWDAVDVIGIQGYFPLNQKTPVTAASLKESWKQIAADLGKFSKAKKRRILFTELGYNQSPLAAEKPWDYATGGIEHQLLQKRCFAAAFQCIKDNDHLVGAFLWKVFPGQRQPRNFNLQVSALEQLIKEHWGAASKKK